MTRRTRGASLRAMMPVPRAVIEDGFLARAVQAGQHGVGDGRRHAHARLVGVPGQSGGVEVAFHTLNPHTGRRGGQTGEGCVSTSLLLQQEVIMSYEVQQYTLGRGWRNDWSL